MATAMTGKIFVRAGRPRPSVARMLSQLTLRIAPATPDRRPSYALETPLDDLGVAATAHVGAPGSRGERRRCRRATGGAGRAGGSGRRTAATHRAARSNRSSSGRPTDRQRRHRMRSNADARRRRAARPTSSIDVGTVERARPVRARCRPSAGQLVHRALRDEATLGRARRRGRRPARPPRARATTASRRSRTHGSPAR